MRRLLFVFVLMIISGSLYAQQKQEIPSDIPEVITYFHTEALSLLHFMEVSKDNKYVEKHNFIPFFCSTHIKADGTFGSGWVQYNGMIGSVLRLNKYLSIPLFFSAAGGAGAIYWGDSINLESDNYYFNNIYTGGGLILSTKFGELGAFAGYYNNWSNYDFFGDKNKRPLQFGTIPVLNTAKYPIIKYVVSMIQNYLSFDFNESKLEVTNSTTKIISRQIETSYFNIPSIYYYYSDLYHTVDIRNRIHGGGLTLSFADGLIYANFEIANKHFYETVSGIYAPNFYMFEKNHWYYEFSLGLSPNNDDDNDDATSFMLVSSWDSYAGIYGYKFMVIFGKRIMDYGGGYSPISKGNGFFRFRGNH